MIHLKNVRLTFRSINGWIAMLGTIQQVQHESVENLFYYRSLNIDDSFLFWFDRIVVVNKGYSLFAFQPDTWLTQK